MTASFLFYDLETFGANPRRSRIAQFAAIRTDEALNEIDEPISFFVQPADDLLPSPVATLITGIAPQDALRDGVNEAEAFARIIDEMARPETCSAGYNSLRFDDEFVRYGLYRNFHDPYEREWKAGNSRWDLLDALRLMHALRPDGIVWRQREDGNGTSFKLEHLAEDNGLRIGDAHEALSDVRATIGLARLFRQHQPRLWEYALRLRNKRYAASLLDTTDMTPLLHVSQRYPASRLCAAPVIPLARHPQIDSRVIVFDLDSEPDALLDLEADAIAERLYIRQADLPEGEARVPLKEVHTNKCPALVAWDHLREADFARLGIDPGVVQQRAARIRAVAPAIAEKVRRVFARERPAETVDADAALYDGFIGDTDKRLFAQVRGTPPHLLAKAQYAFRDARLPELLFRYRARNWPGSLLPAERERWNNYRRERLDVDNGWSESTLAQFNEEIAQLRIAHASDGGKLALLDRLQAWAMVSRAACVEPVLAEVMPIPQDSCRHQMGTRMTRKTKWLLAGIGLLLVAMLGYTAAGPYLAINGIRNVVANGEYGELYRFVDFEKLRASVTPQIHQRIADGIIGHMGAGTASDVVSGVTSMISEPTINAMASPIGIATLLRGSALAKQLTGKTAPSERAKAIDPLKDARTGFDQPPSMFTATVDNAEGQPVVFEFTRSGLAWKLTGLRLPE